MITQLRLMAVGRVAPGIEPVIVSEQDIYERWHAAMQDSLDASREVDDRGAYLHGQGDALMGNPCRPGMYERMVDQIEYLIAYRNAQSTMGHDATLKDAYFMGITDRDLGLPSHAMEYPPMERAAYLAGFCAARTPRPLTTEQILAELDDLRSAMDDEMFWSHHC